MKVSIIVMTCLLFLSGCVSSNPTTTKIRADTREKMLNLSVGMTKQEIYAAMGTETITSVSGHVIKKPYKTEMYRSSKGNRIEILYYYTELKKSDDAITDDELTPLVLIDGKLDGWGRSYWDSIIQMFEIKIR